MKNIKCSLCYEKYTEKGENQPKVIEKCGHTFCLNCLKKLFKTNNSIKCPLKCSFFSLPYYNHPNNLSNNKNLFCPENLFCKNCNFPFDQKNRKCFIDTKNGCSFCKVCIDINMNSLKDEKQIVSKCCKNDHFHLLKNFKPNLEFDKNYNLSFEKNKINEQINEFNNFVQKDSDKKSSENNKNDDKKNLGNFSMNDYIDSEDKNNEKKVNEKNHKDNLIIINNNTENNNTKKDFQLNNNFDNENLNNNNFNNDNFDKNSNSNSLLSIEIIIKKINIRLMEYYQTKSKNKNLINLKNFSNIYKTLINDNKI